MTDISSGEKSELDSNASDIVITSGDQLNNQMEHLTPQDIHNVISVPAVDQLCRVCGLQREHDNLVSIFGERGSELNLHHKIFNHLHLQVEQEDLLPQQVCSACVSHLNICHKLYETSRAADTKLRQLFLLSPRGSESTVQTPWIQERGTLESGNQQHTAEKRVMSESSSTTNLQVLVKNAKQAQENQPQVDEQSNSIGSQVLFGGSLNMSKTMSYGKSWQVSMSKLRYSAWAHMGDIMIMIRKLRETKLHSDESRRQGLDILNGLVTEQVVGPKQRFPEKAIYVNMDDLSLVFIINKLRLALCHKELDDYNISDSIKLYNDIARNFMEDLTAVSVFIKNTNWTRASFEGFHGLTWA